MVARFGGEEFVIILPETDQMGAVHKAEKLRAAVEEKALSEGKSLSVSLGVATAKSADIFALIDAADKALYHAKRSGRNRVIHYADVIAEDDVTE